MGKLLSLCLVTQSRSTPGCIFTRLSDGGRERVGGEPLFTVRNRPEEGGNLELGTLRNFFPKIRPSLTCTFGPPAGAKLPLSFNQDCRKW